MSFWDNVFSGPQQTVVSPAIPNRAWWQDEPQQVYQQQQGTRVPHQQEMNQQDVQQIRKRGHQNISPEEAEAIAEYDLATKAKYQAVCDQCGSGNFILAGTRIAGVIMPTNKCFNCGNSARSPEPAIGGGSGSGSVATRQIDTGGAGGVSMFGRFNGVPRGYAPRA